MRVPALVHPEEADADLTESLGTILTLPKNDVKEKIQGTVRTMAGVRSSAG
jgi:hypothetical protein